MATNTISRVADEYHGTLYRNAVGPLMHIPAHREHPFRTNVNTYSGST
ncbi:hypothetical protein [Marinobacter sp. LV10R510-11A]|nr:hypothetical protein [Marinobacter sp. LV10R510-11A]